MFLRIIQPEYPAEARGRVQEGRGLFRLHVNEHGTVTAVTVLKSTGYRALDSEAIATFKRWVARRGESREVDVPVIFTLSRRYKHTNPTQSSDNGMGRDGLGIMKSRDR
jgi:TonB family protein